MAKLNFGTLLLVGLILIGLGVISIPNFSTPSSGGTVIQGSTQATTSGVPNENGQTLRIALNDPLDSTTTDPTGITLTQVSQTIGSNVVNLADFNTASNLTITPGAKVEARGTYSGFYVQKLDYSPVNVTDRDLYTTLNIWDQGAITGTAYNYPAYVGTGIQSIGASTLAGWKIVLTQSEAYGVWSNPEIGKSLLGVDVNSTAFDTSKTKIQYKGQTYYNNAVAPVNYTVNDGNNSFTSWIEVPFSLSGTGTDEMYLFVESTAQNPAQNTDSNSVVEVLYRDYDFTSTIDGKIIPAVVNPISGADLGQSDVRLTLHVS